MLSRAGFLSGFNAQDIFIEGIFNNGYVRLEKGVLEKGPFDDADFLLIFDLRLLPEIKRLKDGSIIITNSKSRIESPWLKKKKIKAYYLDANSIAMNTIGKPIVNTAMIGALIKFFPKITMKNLKSAIEIEKMPKENQIACEEGFKSVR